jgi:hypothetical protein
VSLSLVTQKLIIKGLHKINKSSQSSLQRIYHRIKIEEQNFQSVDYFHIFRRQNGEADLLAKDAKQLDQGTLRVNDVLLHAIFTIIQWLRKISIFLLKIFFLGGDVTSPPSTLNLMIPPNSLLHLAHVLYHPFEYHSPLGTCFLPLVCQVLKPLKLHHRLHLGFSSARRHSGRHFPLDCSLIHARMGFRLRTSGFWFEVPSLIVTLILCPSVPCVCTHGCPPLVIISR